MKAAVVENWGEPPTYTDFPDPAPSESAVVAEVEASALTNLTRGRVSGKHYASNDIRLPAGPGVDGVTRLEDGRRVYTGALAPYGMMAERTRIDPGGGMSAWMTLEHATAIRPGDHIVVLGATGVTGSLAVQLAGRCSTRAGSSSPVVTSRLEWLGGVEAVAIIRSGRRCSPRWPSVSGWRRSSRCRRSRPVGPACRWPPG
ncbi:NADPH:quinone reductase-like Zn-dependent oxidoreductase [Mycobacterium sp. URHB0021]